MYRLTTLVLSLGLLASCGSVSPDGGGNSPESSSKKSYATWSDALAAAKTDKRAVFLNFGGPW